MATAPFGPLVQHIRKLAAIQCPWNDRQLLERFSITCDEFAFTALLARHGPMVLRVCRNVLKHEQDAEDAFQAAFLVLAKNTKSIRKPEALGDWLHGVAYRTAMKAKRSAARRRNHETQLGAMPPKTNPSPAWDDVQAVLDEEIQRLAGPHRSVFVLCVLEGKSRLEAAAALGIEEGTVASRLMRARQQLQKRLERRGIQLGALLAALSASTTVAHAGVPAQLADATIRSGIAIASGVTTAAVLPAHIAALAAGVSRAMFLTKAKIATAVFLAASLCGSATILSRPSFVASATGGQGVQTPQKQAQVKPVPVQPAKAEDAKDTATYAGQVRGPDKKPVAGAKIYFYFITHQDEPIPARAITDADGRFSFTLARKDVPLSAATAGIDPLKMGHVIVKAENFAFGWNVAAKPASDLAIRLAQDTMPIEGRVLDLEGKPLAGLRIKTLSAWASADGDLSAFFKQSQAGASFYSTALKHLPNRLGSEIANRSLAHFLPSTTTGADGRFRLHGFAKEQLVEIGIEGPTIETQTVYVATRAKAPRPENPLSLPLWGKDEQEMMSSGSRKENAIVHSNGFDHFAPPGQVVTGTVRDGATKEPIPGAIVESYMLAGTNLGGNDVYRTVADAKGRYHLTGLPRGKGNRIRIGSPKDQPYFPVVKDVPSDKELTAATLDVELQRGVWLDVTIKDKATGKPVTGDVGYFVLPEKPPEIPGLDQLFAGSYDEFMPTLTDGTLRITALPRRALVAFRTDSEKYPLPLEAASIQLPALLSATNYQAFAEICPQANEKSVKVEFVLSTGRTVKGKLIGPDDQPVAGAQAAGLRDDWTGDVHHALKSAEFTVLDLKADRPRLVCFTHEEKQLAGSVLVRGNEKEPITVKLAPWGTVSGRLIDAAGKPIKNATLDFTEIPPRKPGEPLSLETGLHVFVRWGYRSMPDPTPRTDEEGRFRVVGLIPGLKYNLAKYESGTPMGRHVGLAFSELVLQSGETKDLGDVTLRPFPKQQLGK